MGIEFNGMIFELNVNKILPTPEEHDEQYLRRNAENVAEAIRDAMSKNRREVYVYNIHPTVIAALAENGFDVIRHEDMVGQLREYIIKW